MTDIHVVRNPTPLRQRARPKRQDRETVIDRSPDSRGEHPSQDELTAFRHDPSALTTRRKAAVEEYLRSEATSDRARVELLKHRKKMGKL